MGRQLLAEGVAVLPPSVLLVVAVFVAGKLPGLSADESSELSSRGSRLSGPECGSQKSKINPNLEQRVSFTEIFAGHR